MRRLSVKNTVIYLVRHGEVVNPRKILYGRTFDVKLSLKGINTTKQTAALLKNRKIHYIYSSPMLRAKKTAEILMKHLDLSEFAVVDHASEVSSTFDGISLDKIEKINGDIFKKPGELIEDVSKRMVALIKKLANKHKGHNIVLVTHGDPMIIAYNYYNKIKPELRKIRSVYGCRYPSYGGIIRLCKDSKSIRASFI